MNAQERLDLKKLLNTENFENNTDHIRNVKHSSKIYEDILKIRKMKKENPDENIDNINMIKYSEECPFLYNNYTDIFNRCVRDELDFAIMEKILNVLKLIEEGHLDQHEGSVVVGKLLKELYIDSAMRRSENLDKLDSVNSHEKVKESGLKISWKEFKANRVVPDSM